MAPRILLCWLIALFCFSASAIDLRYESGFPKAVSFEGNQIESPEAFFEKEFFQLRSVEWKLSRKQEDGTHLHLTYDLFFGEFPVFEQHLKVHWNKSAQAVDYVTSTLEKEFQVEEALRNLPRWESIEEAAAAKLFNRRNFQGLSRGKLGLWLSAEKDKAFWAYDVEAFPRGPEMGKRGILSADLSNVFEEKKVIRHWRGEGEEEEGEGEETHEHEHEREPGTNERAEVDLRVWKTFPTGVSAGSVIVNDFFSAEAGKLINDVAHVRYDREDGNNFSNVGSTSGITSPNDSYGHECNVSTNNCENQKLDSGNVYYHLTQFRTGKLQQIADGVGASLSLPSIPVFINYMAKAVQICADGDKPSQTEQSDNAAYYSGGCDGAGTIPRCLIFLRHATSDFSKTCAGKNIGGSTAREALIVAHEYQHYVTDMIAGIEYGAIDAVIIGDVIHEGYSDYFGAVYSDKTLVGEFAFQSIPNSRRELTFEAKFSQTENYTSGHKPGLVWASALWALRSSLGGDLVNKIAFKSLYYLSTSPGFIDSVEALVQADRALTGGLNGNRIRTLFYDERKFIGTLSNVFQDSEKKIVKVGFQGCASVKDSSSHSLTALNWLTLLGWLLGTLWVGKKTWRKNA